MAKVKVDVNKENLDIPDLSFMNESANKKDETSAPPSDDKKDTQEPSKDAIIKTFEELDLEIIKKIATGEENSQDFNLVDIGTRVLWRISYAGIMKLVRKLGCIHITGEIQADHTAGEYCYIVNGYNSEAKIGNPGVGNVAKTTPYARQIALSVATRNAYRELIDEKEIKELFEEWFEGVFEKKYEQAHKDAPLTII